MEKISNEIFESFKNLPHIGDVTSRILYNEGFRSIKEVAEVDPEELARVLEIEKEKAIEIIHAALRVIRGTAPEADAGVTPSVKNPALDPVDRMEGVGEKTAEVLGANGIQAIQDILKTDVEKLSMLPGIGAKKAEKLVQAAKRYIEREGLE